MNVVVTKSLTHPLQDRLEKLSLTTTGGNMEAMEGLVWSRLRELHLLTGQATIYRITSMVRDEATRFPSLSVFTTTLSGIIPYERELSDLIQVRKEETP